MTGSSYSVQHTEMSELNENFDPEKNGFMPKYERLRMHLVRELAAGRLRPGDALPTEVELAAFARMSRNTVRQALSELEHNGVIRRVPGRGTFVQKAAAIQSPKPVVSIFALVIPETRTGYYPSLQRGFREEAGKLFDQVIVCDSENDPLRQTDILLQLMDIKVAGLALVPATNPATSAHQIRPLQDSGIPVVFCHRRVSGVRAPLVTFSALDVGRMAGRAMLDNGHRKVAFFSTQRAGLTPLYQQGLQEALRAGGGDLPESLVRCDPVGKISAEHEVFLRSSIEELLRLPDPPTVAFCSFDSEAEMLYLTLNRMGIKVPEQMSLVSFGGSWRDGAIMRRLTSVTVDEEELGRHSARLLSEMRSRKRLMDDMTEITLPLHLSEGETLGPAPVPV
jgi:DNA-binding LacI/PurR family transcriptional regulator